MRIHTIVLYCSLLLLCLPLGSAAQTAKTPSGKRVLVETSKGDFTLLLYDDTPRHQANFIRLVQSGDYEGCLFHRVIEQFMIQGGNLSTRGATPDTDVSQDTLSLTIPAEILQGQYIHKRGTLAAAREGDAENPTKASSGSQFYIVTGTYYTDYDLDKIEAARSWRYTPAQREAYRLVGGAPWLDGEYTIFGEVIDGLKTVEKIEQLKTSSDNRPRKDVIIKKMTLLP